MSSNPVFGFLHELQRRVPECSAQVQAYLDASKSPSRSVFGELNLCSDRFNDPDLCRECGITLSLDEVELTLFTSIFHTHYDWRETGPDGQDAAIEMIEGLISERIGLATISEAGWNYKSWVYETQTRQLVEDSMITVIPRLWPPRWPWSKRNYKLITRSFHGTHNAEIPFDEKCKAEWVIPR